MLLFVSGFSLFILRVAQLHVNKPTTQSPASALRNIFLSSQIPYTLVIYLFSAWFFGEIYIWSARPSSDLGWTVIARAYGVPRLNERPIYLRMCLMVFALIQSYYHIKADYSLIPLPLPEWLQQTDRQEQLQLPTAEPPTQRVVSQLLRIVIGSITTSLAAPFIALFVYYIFVRRMAWNTHMWIAQTFISADLRPTSSPQDWAPPAFLSLFLRCMQAGFLLLMLWKLSNSFFTANVALEPLKNGQPLTSGSKDPNGTLIIGLKSKRDVPRAVALWELLSISLSFPERRKLIYSDIDRQPSPTWTAIVDLLLPSISSICAPTPVPAPPPAPTPKSTLQPLPKIGTPMKTGPIFIPSPSTGVSEYLKQDAPTPSQPPQPTLVTLFNHLLTLRTALLNHPLLRTLATTLQTTPLGAIARSTPRRNAASTLLGPAALAPLLYTITSLSSLTVRSVAEDPYGRVSSDVARLVTAYTGALQRTIALTKAVDDEVGIVARSAPAPAREQKRPEMQESGSVRERKRKENGKAPSGKSTEASGKAAKSKTTRPVAGELGFEKRCVEGLWVVAALADGLRAVLETFTPWLGVVGVDAREQREAWEAVLEGEELALALKAGG
ncbi:MAG: hypothetical protein M1814_006268 [Vezdaea aestivalis]|nr:MAG: hypothetical protein M1814_006268 [Vezdaea aestivalis]